MTFVVDCKPGRCSLADNAFRLWGGLMDSSRSFCSCVVLYIHYIHTFIYIIFYIYRRNPCVIFDFIFNSTARKGWA